VKDGTIEKQHHKCAICKRGTGLWDFDHKDGNRSNNSSSNCQAPHVSGAAALYKSLHPTANPFQVDTFLKSTGTKAPATSNPRLPCNGAGRGYFDDRYLPLGTLVLTDKVKEPLLYMGAIK
jgi:hypothetical protein